MNLQDVTVHITGLGLMGASLAMVLRGHVARITGDDINQSVVQAALSDNVIDTTGVSDEYDIHVLAVPPDVIVDLIPALPARPGTLVIDLGSTKTQICEALDRLPEDMMAVGGHPMCGLAENGYQNALPTLYKGARFVLCQTARTTPGAVALATALVEATGAQPLWLERAHHDFLVALTSHVPHLLSFGLMQLALEIGEDEPVLFELAAGGFDGATRLARTNETMIRGMFGTNAAHIRAVMAQLRHQLDTLDKLIDNPVALENELARIVAARRAYTEKYRERPIA